MKRIGTRQDYHNEIGSRILGKEECPFCKPEETKDTLIKSFSFWNIILNKYPYSGDEHHLMAVPLRHVVFSYELNQQELIELQSVYIFMKDFYEKVGEENYFSTTRENLANRSIEHYHMHFIPGKLQGKYVRCMLENQGYPIEAEVKIQK